MNRGREGQETLLNPVKMPSELSAALKRIIWVGVLVGRGLPNCLRGVR